MIQWAEMFGQAELFGTDGNFHQVIIHSADWEEEINYLKINIDKDNLRQGYVVRHRGRKCKNKHENQWKYFLHGHIW